MPKRKTTRKSALKKTGGKARPPKSSNRKTYKPPTVHAKDQDGRVYHEIVPKCNPKKEEVVGYYLAMGDACLEHFGKRPSRQSLWRYLEFGFAARPRGPYVLVPHFYELNRPMTTVQALGRMITAIKYLRSLKPTRRLAEDRSFRP